MSKILHLKIILIESKPEIWRTFLAEDTLTFHDLHNIIQEVMGWEDYHLYDFHTKDNSIIESENKDGIDSMFSAFRPNFKTLLAEKTKLNEFLKKKGQKVVYRYDFGDSWKHLIIVEKILEKDNSQKYPICIAGKMACPPEDCGGTYGYYEMLKALKDKNHPEHNHWKEWIEEFDPEEFNIKKINKNLST